MICNTCTKKRMKKKRLECAVLHVSKKKIQELPIWGDNCPAYSDDPDWEKKVIVVVERYRQRAGVR